MRVYKKASSISGNKKAIFYGIILSKESRPRVVSINPYEEISH